MFWRIFLASILVMGGCTKGREGTVPEPTRTPEASAADALASDRPGPSETHLLYYSAHSSSRKVREHLVELEARRVIASRDPALMELFLVRHGLHPAADRVFGTYKSFLLERINKNNDLEAIHRFMAVCPRCPQVKALREKAARLELEALGPNPSGTALERVARMYPGTEVARRCEAEAARRTVDNRLLFGGPQAWEGDSRNASPIVRRVVAMLRVARALRGGDVEALRGALESLGPEWSTLSGALQGGNARNILKSLKKLMMSLKGGNTSFDGVMRALQGNMDPLEKRDLLWSVIHREDPRMVPLILAVLGNGDLYLYMIGVRALEYRLSLGYEWDRVAASLLGSRLSDSPVPVHRLEQGWLSFFTHGKAGIPDSMGTGSLRFTYLRARMGKVSVAALEKEVRSGFDRIRKNYPKVVSRDNLPLAMAYLRILAAMRDMLQTMNTGHGLVGEMDSFLKTRMDALEGMVTGQGASPDLAVVPSQWRPLRGFLCNSLKLLKKFQKLPALVSKLYPFALKGCGSGR